ncbi:AzlD domain-containing protein [Testudinibacter sp. P80/BLE/0925]|uniref:AzlD domain-containing protein n=1 Tax=Testudinibacter sp. TW-1 TaxID=3417757 RepID=UPI003D3697D1
MSNWQFVLTMFGMAMAIFTCRALPLFLPQRWLQLGWLQHLNRTLPLCIMLILLFSSLTVPNDFSAALLDSVRELLALSAVLASYIWRRNMLLSVVIGVLGINLLYWLI